MADVLRHGDWYLIAGQRFRRRAGVHESRQVFRGQAALVLSDALTGQHLRLSARAAELWRRLDGQHSIQAIWRDLAGRGPDAPSQREMIDWIMQMVTNGVVLSDHTLSPDALSQRTNKRRDDLFESRIASPLAIKIPVFDPSWVIAVTYPLVRPLFSVAGVAVLVALWVLALATATLHWQRITSSADAAVLSQAGIVALVLGYPVMKALHELSHGWTLHHYGGKVREAGVMMLIFFPVPYVDASDANRLPDKRARILISLAGVLAELTVAALACILWVQMEPGPLRAILFSLMIMGTVSTVLFNGNPLLKFDSYFALADALEIPNLAKRAGDHLRDRFCERVLGLRATSDTGADLAPILGIYGTLALIYRLFLSFGIALVVAQLFFGLGVAIAVWALLQSVLFPMWKTGRHAWRTAATQRRSRGMIARAVGLAAVLVVLLGVLPVPQNAAGVGRIVPLASSELRIAGSGFVLAGPQAEGTQVSAGDRLLVLDNPEQAARLVGARISRDSLRATLAQGNLSVADRRIALERLRLAEAALTEIERQAAGRDLVAPQAGRLAWDGGRPPVTGTFLTKGDRVGHVLAPGQAEIVVAFDPAVLGSLSPGSQEIALLWADGRQTSGQWTRARTLDSGAVVPPELRAPSGGPVAVLPEDPSRALLPVQLFWLDAGQTDAPMIGARLDARIALPPSPIAAQLLLRLRQVFLGLNQG